MSEIRKLYAFLNIERPMVAWEVAIGRICSAQALTSTGFGLSVWQFNLFKKLARTNNLKIAQAEFRIEQVRQLKFPEKVSRLSGVYFFESHEMAVCAIDRWGLPGRYKNYISEVVFHGQSYSNYDSEWFTQFASTTDTGWYENYLSGKTLGERPLTEVLATGVGLIQCKELRSHAIHKVIQLWPTSTPLLASAICALAELNMFDVALMTPYLYREGGVIGGHHAINLESLEKHGALIGEALNNCYSKKLIDVPIIVPDDPDKIFAIPDMREEEFKIESQNLTKIFTSIHG